MYMRCMVPFWVTAMEVHSGTQVLSKSHTKKHIFCYSTREINSGQAANKSVLSIGIQDLPSYKIQKCKFFYKIKMGFFAIKKVKRKSVTYERKIK